MSSNNGDYMLFKPPPPPNLSKEHLGIWLGWCCKGDREVSREAAAKGIQVELVASFLSTRKKISPESTELYFKEEVLLWVRELLDRKQIFRVSHVLTNIGVNPEKEFIKVFYSTTKKDLREYIGNHLKKIDKLSDNMKELWHFLDLILNNNILISKKNRMSEDSIECLDKQNYNWKSEIAAKLFLRTHESDDINDENDNYQENKNEENDVSSEEDEVPTDESDED